MAAVEKGTLDKKNNFGVWTKKFVKLDGLVFTVADSETSAPIFSSTVSLITRAGEGNDPLSITVQGEKQGEMINLKHSDAKVTSHWYDLIYRALERAGKAKPRNAGLPAKDPRFDLPYVKIPGELAFNFLNLETAVIYWFGVITKYGAPNKITRKPQVETRVLFIGDKCIYVTKENSEVTRCMKMQLLSAIYTNIGDPKAGKDEQFVVFKMKLPEYDLWVSGANMANLIEVVSTIYKYMTKGVSDLPVHPVPTAMDPKVDIKLNRPENFEMTVVRPITKTQLKQALDNFAAKHGITFAPAEPAPIPPISGTPAAGGAGAAPAPTTGGTPAAVEGTAKGPVPSTDPLGCFLLKLGLDQYYHTLAAQSIDLDVLECMDDADMKNFGLKDPKIVALIREKMANVDFMEQVHNDVESARKDAKWAPKKAPDAVQQEKPAAVAPQQSAPAPTQPASRPPIILDDDDDDLLVASPSKSIGMAICLDSDDDLDLPPKPAGAPAAKPPIILDDDDI